MRLKALTFDFWNTLAFDRDPVKVRQLAADRMIEEIREIGCVISRERMLEAFAEAREVCYRHQEDMGIDFTPEEQVDWICDRLGLEGVSSLKHVLLGHYTTSLLDIPPVFAEDLRDTLNMLKEKYKLAIICNTGRTPGWVIREILSDQKLDRYFDVGIFSNEVGLAKPNPGIFLKAARELGVLPCEALHIGDDTHTDVYGAKRAGFRAGWFNPDNLTGQVDCDIEIKRLSDIQRMIKEG